MNAPSKPPKKQSGTVTIHGREYQTVALRVQMFREAHPDYALTTAVLFRDADCVVMQATIADAEGRTLASGHAEERRNSSQINKTSALENAETSAIGRALAALGIGGTEFATANEVQNAVHQQNNPQTGEVDDEQREPVKGIHKIKERLRTLINDGSKAIDLDSFNALVSQHKSDLETIREANHSWWHGDGEDFEGFRSFIKRRREELTPQEESARFQLIMSGIEECTSSNELKAWFAQHGDQIGLLDGEESRLAEAKYEEKAAALAQLDTTTTGA